MKVIRIHQIEITSRCNLACRYCVHPKMTRPKGDMLRDVYQRALELAKHCVNKFGQMELNLAGIGESTMHPLFIEYLHMAREAVGPRCRIVLATNGIALTKAQAQALQSINADVWVSMHRPEKAGPAIEMLKQYDVLKGISVDPSVAAIDWAGQVDWHVSTKVNEPCPWLSEGQVMVTSMGDLVTCCLDGDGKGIVGNVWDELKTIQVNPYELCTTCHLQVPIACVS